MNLSEMVPAEENNGTLTGYFFDKIDTLFLPLNQTYEIKYILIFNESTLIDDVPLLYME